MKKTNNYWLVKTDPDTYSWDNLLKDKKTVWDGVRNYQARNYLKEMNKNDLVLFYHSQSDKAIFRVAKVTKEGFQDPTTQEQWFAVELSNHKSFKKPVTLQQIKANSKLKNIALIKQSRLSVMPVSLSEFNEIIKMSE